jgi:small multidrug resistance pump
MPIHFFYLIYAVLAETVGTTALQTSQQFTRPLPPVVVVIAYAAAFYLLSLTLTVMPVGLVYAICSGLGIVFIAGIGFVVFGQQLNLAAILSIAMIQGGILVIHLVSKENLHE